MAEIIDETQPLNISLIQEGLATIISFTSDKASARAGETVHFEGVAMNDSQITDTFIYLNTTYSISKKG